MVVEPCGNEADGGPERQQNHGDCRYKYRQDRVSLLDVHTPSLYARVDCVVQPDRQGAIQPLVAPALVRVLEVEPRFAAEAGTRVTILPWARLVAVVGVFKVSLFGVPLLVFFNGNITTPCRRIEVEGVELEFVSEYLYQRRRRERGELLGRI